MESPGSPGAIRKGCICPVLDNAHGRGYMGGRKNTEGEMLYVVQQDCPLHGEEDLLTQPGEKAD